MTNLFTPYDLNGLRLPNRIVMAPMTRTRAMENGVPTELMVDYYVQRASAGLNITECTQVSDQAHGIIRAPGIHRDDQIAGWRKITDAVHEAGGRIYNQIWHAGRVSHPEIRNGDRPVGPSPIPASGNFFLPRGRVDFPVPRELDESELPRIIEDCPSDPECARGRLRRGRTARSQRLPAGSVPAGRVQPPDRRVGWDDRQPSPPPARNSRSHGCGLVR
jgi:N-ethylmaleimide reductase